jgi:hypothetical protein
MVIVRQLYNKIRNEIEVVNGHLKALDKDQAQQSKDKIHVLIERLCVLNNWPILTSILMDIESQVDLMTRQLEYLDSLTDAMNKRTKESMDNAEEMLKMASELQLSDHEIVQDIKNTMKGYVAARRCMENISNQIGFSDHKKSEVEYIIEQVKTFADIFGDPSAIVIDLQVWHSLSSYIIPLR